MRPRAQPLVALLLSACDPAAPSVAPPEGLRASEVEYLLSVDWEGATEIDGVYQFETDLGYIVGVERWTLSSTALELVPCQELRGHSGTYTPDVSRVDESFVQELKAGEPVTLGPVSADGGEYCDVYQILGPIAGEDGEERVSTVVGWYIPPGSADRVEFEAINTVPFTVLPPVGDGTWDHSLPADVASVELQRSPARAFDGLEIAELSPLELSFFAASALAQDAEVTWRLGPSS